MKIVYIEEKRDHQPLTTANPAPKKAIDESKNVPFEPQPSTAANKDFMVEYAYRQEAECACPREIDFRKAPEDGSVDCCKKCEPRKRLEAIAAAWRTPAYKVKLVYSDDPRLNVAEIDYQSLLAGETKNEDNPAEPSIDDPVELSQDEWISSALKSIEEDAEAEIKFEVRPEGPQFYGDYARTSKKQLKAEARAKELAAISDSRLVSKDLSERGRDYTMEQFNRLYENRLKDVDTFWQAIIWYGRNRIYMKGRRDSSHAEREDIVSKFYENLMKALNEGKYVHKGQFVAYCYRLLMRSEIDYFRPARNDKKRHPLLSALMTQPEDHDGNVFDTSLQRSFVGADTQLERDAKAAEFVAERVESQKALLFRHAQTDRETEIVRAKLRGETNRVIAAYLNVDERTIRRDWEALKERLGAEIGVN